MNNRQIAQEIFTLLPVNFFLSVARKAPARTGFGYNDYICIFGQDPEADPGEEFDGVRISLLSDEHIITELDLFEGALDACDYYLSRHPGIASELEEIIDALNQEIAKLPARPQSEKARKYTPLSVIRRLFRTAT
ncbi:hypothetical protein [Lysobacter capsici]|uniref:hypothetical protein n=1 Tax=Lysobacter capsici TaxID=435897 RepID=UPI0012FD4D84|nr:hypothetical protein [Lysobacter capsici]